ncbi:MAG: type II secretion system F family protein [Verrucomicrobia bacterium]|nr:type II secretion system F family protein [Verrucomicrobiota bacterium]
MAIFNYVALDSRGKEKTGSIEADSQSAAVSRIKEKGLFPTNVAEGASGTAKGKKKARGARGGAKGKGMSKEIRMPVFLSRVKPKQLMAFTRQLATLVNAGLPLIRGLEVLQRQERNPALRNSLGDIAESIQSGSTFAEAMSQHTRIFNRLYVNMVKAGEIGGVLDIVLLRLAEFMEKAQKIKSKVISAMVYPIVVLIMAVIIVSALMIFIIPKFEEIFTDLMEGKSMPMLTQFVLKISETVSQKFVLVLGVVVAVVFLVKLVGKTNAGRFVMDHLKLHMPIFGVLTQKTAIARFTRTLGTLMSSGVPVLQALNIVRDTAGNQVIARAVSQIHDNVKEGENMAPTIEASNVFPPMVVSMVEVGEETGELPEMLMKIADSYDDEVDNTVAALTSIIEPLLIIFLALVVGTIVIALFLPLLSIIGSLSG